MFPSQDTNIVCAQRFLVLSTIFDCPARSVIAHVSIYIYQDILTFDDCKYPKMFILLVNNPQL
ncbi:hypothetical protein Plhal304r1_c040g0117901 [Plasmopara halstedii]